MKKLLLTFVCLFAIQLSLWAQKPISATSTAEECIAFIQQTVNSRSNPMVFNGTTLVNKGINETSKYINWAKFKDVEVSKGSGYSTHIYLNFKEPFLVQVEIINRDGMLVFRDFKTRQKLLFIILAAREDEINTIKTAANRLAQIAKTKQSKLLEVQIPDKGIKPFLNVSETRELLAKKLETYGVGAVSDGLGLNFEFTPNRLYGYFKVTTHDDATKKPAVSRQIMYTDLDKIFIKDNKINFIGKMTEEDLKTNKSVEGYDMHYSLKPKTPPSEIKILIETINHWLWLQGIE